MNIAIFKPVGKNPLQYLPTLIFSLNPGAYRRTLVQNLILICDKIISFRRCLAFFSPDFLSPWSLYIFCKFSGLALFVEMASCIFLRSSILSMHHLHIWRLLAFHCRIIYSFILIEIVVLYAISITINL